MSDENASFLKMIGIDEEEDTESTEQDPAQSHVVLEETTEKIKDDFEEDEATEKGLSSETWDQTEISVVEVFEEVPRQPDLNNRTAVYSESEYEDVLQEEVYKEHEEADRLLEGIEEADASRATDIFANSFRVDQRRTNTLDIEEDSFAGFDEDSELEQSETEPGGEPDKFPANFDSLEEERSDTGTRELQIEELSEEFNEPAESLGEEDPARSTLAFEYDQPASDENYERFVVLDGKALNGEEFSIVAPPVSIGRDPANEIIIDDVNVSRFHAEVRKTPEGLKLIDMGSTNGIKVNGSRVTEHILASHDLVQIGEVYFEFLMPHDELRGLDRLGAARETEVTGSQAGTSNSKKRKNLIRITAALLVVAGILFVYQAKSKISQKAQEQAAQLVTEKAEADLQGFRARLEKKYGKPVSDLDDATIKKEVEKKIDSYSILPENLKEQVSNVSPKVLRLFLENPKMFADFAQSGGDQTVLWKGIRHQMQQSIQNGKDEEALQYVELLLSVYPKDTNLLKLEKDLKEKTAYVQMDHVNDKLTAEDRQKFVNYMNLFNKRVQDLIANNQLKTAKKFAETVKQRILELVQKQPAFGSLAESAIAEWSSRLKSIEQKTKEQNTQDHAAVKKQEEGDKLIMEIRSYMNNGRVNEASQEVEKFLRDYPHHPDINVVKSFRKEIDQAITTSFTLMKESIDQYIQTENYKLAWQALYRFTDLIPGYPPALDLKKELEQKTKMKAAQYYNQGRVFEFEADDLIAAEQYYKKSLDTVDPQSDLASKAKRRYKDVQRKSIQ